MQSQKLKQMLLLILLPALMWVTLACGGQEEAESPPTEAVEQEAAAEPSTQEDARARRWS